ncbi:hypothetical protein ACE6H2_025991 [Prunus campanulata]
MSWLHNLNLTVQKIRLHIYHLLYYCFSTGSWCKNQSSSLMELEMKLLCCNIIVHEV